MDTNKALRAAIANHDMENFLHLLHKPDINLNFIDEQGITPLTASLRAVDGVVMAKCLIEAGCDVNLKARAWYNSPLHLAIIYMKHRPQSQYGNLARMLMQKGADVNHQAFMEDTPLHRAVSDNNLEAVSMLLYYEADVNITQHTNRTPLMDAFKYKDICEVLINYYDNFSCRETSLGFTVIHFAALEHSPLVVDLWKRGASVNCVDDEGNSSLFYALWNSNANLFKFLWSKIDHSILVGSNSSEPFLFKYVTNCEFSFSEYYECLYLLLESPIAPSLIEHYRNHPVFKYSMYEFCIFNETRPFEGPKHRFVSLIFIMLSLGIEVRMHDLKSAYELYGCGQEFQALIYAGNLNCYDYTQQMRQCKNLEKDFYIKGFASLQSEKKESLISQIPQYMIDIRGGEILEALNKLPEFPSLLELSRNAAQTFIQQNCKVTKLYQFYDVVKCLKLPQVLKDIILLEEPIYK